MSITLDPQVNGVVEDFSGEGVVMTAPKLSGLVRVPFRNLGVRYITQNGASSGWQEHDWGNPDGSNSGLEMACTSNPFPNNSACSAGFYFSGKSLGLYWRDIAGMSDFTAIVDFVAYKVTALPAEGILAGDDAQGISQQIVANHLPTNGPHYCLVNLTGDGVTSRTLVLYGALLESRVGYATPPRISAPGLNTLLTTVQTALAVGTAPMNMRFVDKISYFNSSASAVTITIQAQGVTLKAVTIPGGGDYEYAFAAPGAYLNVTHAASVAGVVNAILWGGS